MKTRLHNLIVGIFAMFIANLVYFFWMPYPKSFLKTLGSATFIFDILTNLLYFVLYAVILTVAIHAISNAGYKLRKKKILAAIGICVAVQLGCDIIRFIAEYLTGQFSPISNDFFTVVCIAILFLVTVKFLGIQAVNYKKLFVVFLPISIIVLTVCIIMDISYIQNVSNALEKYFNLPTNILSALSLLDSSSVGAVIAKNFGYMYEIRNAILDFTAETAFLFALYYSTVQDKVKGNDNEESYSRKSHFISRIASILLIAPIICGLKFFVLPQNFLKTTNMQRSHSNSTTPSFDYNRTFITIGRAISYSETKEIYRKTHGKLYYGEKKMLDIYMDYEYEENPIETRTVNHSEVKIICHNQAIAYLKNGEPYAVTFADIEKQSRDDLLLEVCKQLLEEGRIDCFEYISDYVGKYDPDFVKPYLERYSAGNFTESELQQMGDINPDYIKKCAKQFVSQ